MDVSSIPTNFFLTKNSQNTSHCPTTPIFAVILTKSSLVAASPVRVDTSFLQPSSLSGINCLKRLSMLGPPAVSKHNSTKSCRRCFCNMLHFFFTPTSPVPTAQYHNSQHDCLKGPHSFHHTYDPTSSACPTNETACSSDCILRTESTSQRLPTRVQTY